MRSQHGKTEGETGTLCLPRRQIDCKANIKEMTLRSLQICLDKFEILKMHDINVAPKGGYVNCHTAPTSGDMRSHDLEGSFLVVVVVDVSGLDT
jgi:hypothetical protein